MELTCNAEAREAQMDEATALIAVIREVSAEDRWMAYGFLLGRQSAQDAKTQSTAAQ